MKRFKKAADIKGAVIGYGPACDMGREHLTEMKNAGAVPTAVCDVNPERRAVAAKDWPGIETYSSVSQMLRKSAATLVTVITPHSTHAPLAMQCLAAGRNVITEKPMAVSTAQCDAMIAMARKKGVMLSTYHNRHWDGCIMQAGKTIRSGAIGDVVRIEGYMQGYGVADTWRGSKSATGGILFDWGVHFMEYMLQIAGAELAEVSGFASSGVHAKTSRWRRDTIEDEAMAVVRFRDGKWLTLCISNIDCNPKREWVEVTGTEGTYLFDYKEWQVITKADGVLTTAKGANPESQSRRYYSNVVAHLVKGTPLVITPEWARRPVHVLDLADRSAKSGRSLQARYK